MDEPGHEEQRRVRWEMAVRIEKIIATVLDEAHRRQVKEVMDVLSKGPEGLYKRPPYWSEALNLPPVLAVTAPLHRGYRGKSALMVAHSRDSLSPGDRTRRAIRDGARSGEYFERFRHGVTGDSKKNSYSRRIPRTRFVHLRHSRQKTRPFEEFVSSYTTSASVTIGAVSIPHCWRITRF
jgi:hypothetical protein